jgi:pimeloyl-ACP methyl ester carboxylesterase
VPEDYSSTQPSASARAGICGCTITTEPNWIISRAINVSLTGAPLMILLIAAAVILPIALALAWRRLPSRVGGAALRVGMILGCQAVAVLAVFAAVNRAYLFYDSWDELLGHERGGGQVAVADAGQLVPVDGSQGRISILTVHGKVSGATEQVLIWFPPQYADPAESKTRFPVLMALPGQPGTPAGIFKTLNLASTAMQAIKSGQAKPFVAVIPPLSVAQPRDTECTDIPRGPQADSWLATDVKEAVIKHFRVTPAHWSTIGWSTGAFCASKMLLRHPTSFVAAVSIGGYFNAEEDHSTGNLFNHSRVLRNQNSPLWLIRHTLSYPVHLLIITSKGDRESWNGVHYADAQKAIAAAKGIPGVSTIVLPRGGHNFSTYAPTVGPALAWLGKNAGL